MSTIKFFNYEFTFTQFSVFEADGTSSDLGTGNVVKDSRGSRDLANGQVGLFRMAGPTARGVQAVGSLDGYGKNELFQIQVGTGRKRYFKFGTICKAIECRTIYLCKLNVSLWRCSCGCVKESDLINPLSC